MKLEIACARILRKAVLCEGGERGGGYWEQTNLHLASAVGLLLGRMTVSEGEQLSL